ncbi:MAG TPA: sialidase family protein [Acidimicrobiales bacterium]|nr:sialidase family protein [Acidimicrobiales bacterium]
MGRRGALALVGTSALVGALVGAPISAGAASSCDLTVAWGKSVPISGTTSFTKTVCLVGIPAGRDSLLDVRAWPKNPKTDSVNVELDKADGTYLRSSKVAKTGAIQRVALADVRESTYSITVSSPLVTSVAGVGVDQGVSFAGSVSLGDVPKVGTAFFGNGPVTLPQSGDGEPSIAVDRNNPKARNTVFVTAPVGVPSLLNPISTGNGSGGVDLWRSGPHGYQYQNVSLGDGGGDSHVIVDGAGGVYVADLAAADINLAKSTDEGATFSQMPPAGNTTADREWLALGGGAVGPQTLFLAYHDFATQEFWECQGPASGAAEQDCAPIVPANNPGLFVTSATNTIVGPQVALPGGGVAMPGATSTTAENLANGTSGPMDHLYALVSPDGSSWKSYPIVALPDGDSVANIFPVMAGDPMGNLYTVWSQQNDTDHSGAPEGPITLYLSSSTDRGKHWSHPVSVSQTQDGSAVLPWIAAPSPGHVVIGYVASTTRDNPNDATANWYLKTAVSTNLFGPGKPAFSYSYVIPEPIRYGEVCVSGIFCTQQGDDGRSLLDFASVDYDSSGCAVYAVPSSAREATYPSGSNMLTQTLVAHQTTGCAGPPASPSRAMLVAMSSGGASAGAGRLGSAGYPHWVNLRAHIRHI